MFQTVEEAIYYIEHIQRTSKRKDLSRIIQCAEYLHHPETSFKIIHIAGTNGKGSTACYIKNILMEKGYKVGFFISPYVLSFHERIQINDTCISDVEIIKYANQIHDLSARIFVETSEVITFFEALTLMGLLHFRENQIDVAVIECGLGGLLDATNFIEADISVITNIGMDHMNSLGNTIEEIAAHKLGIVKQDGILFTSVEKELLFQFEEDCRLKHASLYYTRQENIDYQQTNKLSFIYNGLEYELSILGKFQIQNAILAIEVCKNFCNTLAYDEIFRGLKQAKWPGRMEVLQENPLLILDGGHNPHAIEAVVSSLKDFSKTSFRIVYTSLGDKDYTSIIDKLDRIACKYYFTTIPDARKIDPSAFTSILPHVYCDDYLKAIKMAIQECREDEGVLVIGSLHFASLVRKHILEKETI